MSLLYDANYEKWTTSCDNRTRVDYRATSEYNKGYTKGLEEAQVRFDIALNKAQKIVDVKFNPPATIIFWEDGTKTVVKCQDGDEFDPEKGFAMAYCKKMMGNKGRYFQNVKKWTKNYTPKNDDTLKNSVDALQKKTDLIPYEQMEKIEKCEVKETPLIKRYTCFTCKWINTNWEVGHCSNCVRDAQDIGGKPSNWAKGE